MADRSAVKFLLILHWLQASNQSRLDDGEHAQYSCEEDIRVVCLGCTELQKSNNAVHHHEEGRVQNEAMVDITRVKIAVMS